jgi:2-oxoglutarate ferredoxin oxidoreductase subunit alpha
MIGQMMEPVVFKEPKPRKYNECYKLNGAGEGKCRLIRGLILDALAMEEHNWKLYRKYQVVAQKEVRYETFRTEDADLVVVAYGTAARIAKGAIKRSREQGLKVGLIRPITLWPFPYEAIKEISKTVGNFLVFEMSTGQMLEDVKLALGNSERINFYGRPGGVVPTPAELAKIITQQFKVNNIDPDNQA